MQQENLPDVSGCSVRPPRPGAWREQRRVQAEAVGDELPWPSRRQASLRCQVVSSTDGAKGKAGTPAWPLGRPPHGLTSSRWSASAPDTRGQ